jgi:hypothetical protein
MAFSSDIPLQTNQLPISVDLPPEPEQLRTVLTDNYKKIANIMNTKEGALYLTQELATYIQYFTPDEPFKNRNGYRKVVNFGALPNTAAKTVAHGITFDADSTLTRLYASATDPVNLLYIPIPYASSVLASNIEISLDATNVIITTGSNRSAYTTCYVVIEWLKN